MSLVVLRRWAFAGAALLVLPVLATTLALPVAPHAGHDCPFEKDCITCRWAADTVTELAVPVVLAGLPQPTGIARQTPAPPALEAPLRPAASRGPPQA